MKNINEEDTDSNDSSNAEGTNDANDANDTADATSNDSTTHDDSNQDNAQQNANDNSQNTSQQNNQNSQDKPKRFDKLSINKTLCFGYSEYAEYVKKNLNKNDNDYKTDEELESMKNWVDMIADINDIGWSKFAEKNLERFENSLKDDIEKSYYNIATVEWFDAKTETKWVTKYINDKMLWRLEISDSPNANVLKDDNIEFFKSEKFINHIGKLGDIVINAIKKFKSVVQEHIENGELLNVDEVKLSTILYWIEEDEKSLFMTNFRTGQFTNRK